MKKKYHFNILEFILILCAMLISAFAIILFAIMVRGCDFDKWVWAFYLFIITTIGTGILAGILRLIRLFEYQNTFLEEDKIEENEKL